MIDESNKLGQQVSDVYTNYTGTDAYMHQQKMMVYTGVVLVPITVVILAWKRLMPTSQKFRAL